MSPAATKSSTAPSLAATDQATGSTYSSPKKPIMRPRTWATANKGGLRCFSAAARAGEQAFHLFDVAPVGEEHDHVVVVGDQRVVVRDVHFVAAHHRADGGALGKRDLAHAFSHHARSLVRTVHHGLERLGRAATQ